MNSFLYVPGSLRDAGRQLRLALASPLESLPKQDFLRAWSTVAYLFPGLHPDGFDDIESGWPRVMKRFAVEAWRRNDDGELSDDELYPSDAQWSGVYDRLGFHEEDEIVRRLELAVSSSD